MAPSPAVTRTIYRSLLRSAQRYGQNPVLLSLLHRTGKTDSWNPSQGPYDCRRRSDSCTSSDDDNIPDDALRSVHLPADAARDLTRSYSELRRSYYRNARAADRGEQRASGASVAALEESSPTSDDDGTTVKIQIISGEDFDDHLEDIVMAKFREGCGETPPHQVLFRRLLQEVMGGGDAQMRFPSEIIASNDLSRLEEVIRREFRAPDLDECDYSSSIPATSVNGVDVLPVSPISTYFSTEIRRECAFLALRELNKKIMYAESMGMNLRSNAPTRGDAASIRKRQAAKDVHPVPTKSPASYLRPGTFLVSHPLMPSYFERSVIVILEHTEPSTFSKEKLNKNEMNEGESRLEGAGGTYGVIINRPSVSSIPSGRPRQRVLREVLRPDCLPESLRAAFGESTIREGGPVNVSIQMLHTANPETEECLKIGGTLLPPVLPSDRDEQFEAVSTATDSDSAVYFNADLIKASQAVREGEIDVDDFTFFVGASVWTVGQLQSEIERGFWMPCRGPPHISFSGMCEHEEESESDDTLSSRNATSRPKADLWLSMMSALGEEESELAHLILNDKVGDNAKACDEF